MAAGDEDDELSEEADGVVQTLNLQLQALASDHSHAVVLNVLRALVRFNHDCDSHFRNGQMVSVITTVCRRVVRLARDAHGGHGEKDMGHGPTELWSHSENAEVATGLVSAVQAIWPYLSASGRKHMKPQLKQLRRTGEETELLDPVICSMLQMIVPEDTPAKGGGALAGVLQRMAEDSSDTTSASGGAGAGTAGTAAGVSGGADTNSATTGGAEDDAASLAQKSGAPTFSEDATKEASDDSGDSRQNLFGWKVFGGRSTRSRPGDRDRN